MGLKVCAPPLFPFLWLGGATVGVCTRVVISAVVDTCTLACLCHGGHVHICSTFRAMADMCTSLTFQCHGGHEHTWWLPLQCHGGHEHIWWGMWGAMVDMRTHTAGCSAMADMGTLSHWRGHCSAMADMGYHVGLEHVAMRSPLARNFMNMHLHPTLSFIPSTHRAIP